MASDLLRRFALSLLAGQRFGSLRDFYAVFGYESNPQYDHYLAKYIRQDVAARVIDAPAAAVWKSPPIITGGSDFTTKWDALVKKHRLWNMFERIDRLAGLGHYAVLLIGFDSQISSLEFPVRKAKGLLYLQPYSEKSASIREFNSDTRDPRYALPEMYAIKLVDPKRVVRSGSLDITAKTTMELPVHHSRTLHVAEAALEDTIIGIPRMSKVFNILDDLMKTSGGAAETFWLVGNRGLHADIDKEMELGTGDTAALGDEIDEYQHQLRRVIRTRGVKITSLGSDTPDPSGVFNMLMGLLSGATGIPRRILLGSEAGQLASEQDRANWAERIEERRTSFAEPVVLLPFIRKMQDAEVLPLVDDIEIEWPNAFHMSPLEENQAMAQKARAAVNLSKQNDRGTPVTTVEESREIIGLPAEGAPEQVPQEIPSPTDGKDDEDDEDDQSPRKDRQESSDVVPIRGGE